MLIRCCTSKSFFGSLELIKLEPFVMSLMPRSAQYHLTFRCHAVMTYINRHVRYPSFPFSISLTITVTEPCQETTLATLVAQSVVAA